MKKFFIRSLALLFGACVIFYAIIFALLLPTKNLTFVDHYQRGFIYQYRAIEREEGRKIINVGGSNIAYNIDSDLMGEITGIPTYNLGIHAGMGYIYVVELAEDLVKEGDIVVFPLWIFEPNNDFGMDLTWMTLEGQPDMVFDLIAKHPLRSLRTIGSFGLRKAYASLLGTSLDTWYQQYVPSESNGYSADCFDPNTGNYIFERKSATSSYEQMLRSNFKFLPSDFEDDYVAYLNSFIDACRKKGATVYFTYFTVMRDSVLNTDEELLVYEQKAKELFPVTFLGNMKEYFYDYQVDGVDYYYNAITHLTSAGMKRYTTQIATHLVEELSK